MRLSIQIQFMLLSEPTENYKVGTWLRVPDSPKIGFFGGVCTVSYRMTE